MRKCEKRVDVIAGAIIGEALVLSVIEGKPARSSHWRIRCRCGNECTKCTQSIKTLEKQGMPVLCKPCVHKNIADARTKHGHAAGSQHAASPTYSRMPRFCAAYVILDARMYVSNSLHQRDHLVPTVCLHSSSSLKGGGALRLSVFAIFPRRQMFALSSCSSPFYSIYISFFIFNDSYNLFFLIITNFKT